MQNPSLESPTPGEYHYKSDLHDNMAGEVFDESEIKALLRNPLVPDPESRYSRYVGEAAEKLRSIDDEIIRLMKVRKDLRKTHDLVKGLFAPIRRLPVEILGEILELSAHSSTIFFDETTDIMRISQVCHHWRHVTRSMPRLWAGHWNVMLDETDETYRNLISYHLLMSQSIPLDLEIYAFISRRDVNPVHHEELFRLLLSEADRWHSVSFTTANIKVWNMVHKELRKRPRPLDGYFPNLRNLAINIAYLPCGTHKPIHLFADAPLSSLTLECVRPGSFTFSYSHLKSMSLKMSSVESFNLNILHQCSALEKLTLDYRDRYREPMPLPSLSTLVELELMSHDSSTLSSAFRDLIVPSLQVLRVRAQHPIDWPSTEFTSMVSNSACSLQTLQFSNWFRITRSQLEELFRLTPTLTCLILEDIMDSVGSAAAELCKLLTIQPSVQCIDDVLLPRLMKFIIKSRLSLHSKNEVEMVRKTLSKGPLEEETLATMVKSRQPSPIAGVSFLKMWPLGA